MPPKRDRDQSIVNGGHTHNAAVPATASAASLSAAERQQSYNANVKLCRLVKKCPWVYDRSHLNYGKKSILDKSWSKIAKECNDSVASCKERWRNIRAAFARSINIYKTHGGPNRVKPYYLHDELKFLQKTMTADRINQSAPNLNTKKECRAETDDAEDNAEDNTLSNDNTNDNSYTNDKDDEDTGGAADVEDEADDDDDNDNDDDEHDGGDDADGDDDAADGAEDDDVRVDMEMENASRQVDRRDGRLGAIPNAGVAIFDEDNSRKALENDSSAMSKYDKSSSDTLILESHTQMASDGEVDFHYTDDLTQLPEAEVEYLTILQEDSHTRRAPKRIKLDGGCASATLNDSTHIKFFESLVPHMRTLNLRQCIVFKRKIFEALEEVFQMNHDFPKDLGPTPIPVPTSTSTPAPVPIPASAPTPAPSRALRTPPMSTAPAAPTAAKRRFPIGPEPGNRNHHPTPTQSGDNVSALRKSLMKLLGELNESDLCGLNLFLNSNLRNSATIASNALTEPPTLSESTTLLASASASASSSVPMPSLTSLETPKFSSMLMATSSKMPSKTMSIPARLARGRNGTSTGGGSASGVGGVVGAAQTLSGHNTQSAATTIASGRIHSHATRKNTHAQTTSAHAPPPSPTPPAPTPAAGAVAASAAAASCSPWQLLQPIQVKEEDVDVD